MDPATIMAIVSAVASVAGTAGTLMGDKGSEIGMTSSDPKMDEYRRQLMEMVMARIGTKQPYAPVNTMNLAANNMASQYYTGQPYTHQGYGMQSMGGPGAGPKSGQFAGGSIGMPQVGGNSAPMPGSFPPSMAMAMPQGVPQGMPQGQPGPQYGPQLQKGANFAR